MSHFLSWRKGDPPAARELFWSMGNFGFHRELDLRVLQALFAPRTWEGWSITTFTVNNCARACVNVCWVLPEALTSGGTPAEYPLGF